MLTQNIMAEHIGINLLSTGKSHKLGAHKFILSGT